LGAGSPFGAGEARMVETMAKPRRIEGNCIFEKIRVGRDGRGNRCREKH
jgi:hypothetical protein